MKKTILVLVALVGCSIWGFSQTNGPNGPNSTDTRTNLPAVTIQGCLESADGVFRVHDKDTGNNYYLEGDATTLSPHVGHEVKVTGKEISTPTNQASAQHDTTTGDTKALGGHLVLEVSSIEHVAASCSQ